MYSVAAATGKHSSGLWVGSQGSNGLHKSDAGYLDAVDGFDRYMMREIVLWTMACINGDPSFNGNRTILKNEAKRPEESERKERSMAKGKKRLFEHRKVSKRRRSRNKRGLTKERKKRKKRDDDTFASQKSLSHDLFGDDDDDASFDGGSLFGGKDDIHDLHK